MKIRGLVLLLFAFCFLLTGCALTEKEKTTSSQGILEPQAMLKFSDLPVPVGFKLIPLESYSFEASGVRVGLLKYKGKGDAGQIIDFYKEQMAMYNWSILNVVEYGQSLLNFDRENETCIISLQPKGSTIFITAAIGPKSQQVTKKNKPIK